MIVEMSARKGVARRTLSESEIQNRLFFPMINEGFRILEEGFAQKPTDIDVCYVHSRRGRNVEAPSSTNQKAQFGHRAPPAAICPSLTHPSANRRAAFDDAPIWGGAGTASTFRGFVRERAREGERGGEWLTHHVLT